MKEFSIYDSKSGIKQVLPTGTINLKTCADLIRTDARLIQMTNELRSLQDPDVRKVYKASLPYVTFTGTFKKRAAKNLVERSEYFVIDIDHCQELKEKIILICKFFTPALAFVSPSGDGLKVIFQIDPEAGTHLEFFTALRYFFKTKIDVSIDEACKDISRATFLCHDENVFISDEPDVLDQNFVFTAPELVETVTDELARYNGAKKWTNKRVTFMEGTRNQYVTELAGACHRFGISENFIINQLVTFAENGFTIQEIQKTVRSIYNNVAYAGIAEKETSLIRKDNPFIRVGTTYYKVILKTDRHNIERKESKVWTKDILITDYGKAFLKTIPRYDDFVMIPDNVNWKPVINNCYNLYSEFRHIPAKGEWLWTKRLLKHVFGEQYDLGLRYMQILYLHPDRSTIIVAVVSKERGTAKTTFLNWINMLFGANVSFLSSGDFKSDFNSYATSNIICIEETLFEKKLTTEKLKALATAKFLQINPKFVNQYKIPFYGKVILTSNNEEKFAQIDDEEIRFFVRKVGIPEFTNHAVEDNLLAEIPAFLDYLKTLPPVDWTVSRSGFTGKELVNEFLYAVVKESESTLCKELRYLITDFFYNCEHDSFMATPGDLKQKYFYSNNNYGIEYIGSVLRNEIKLQAEKPQRYEPLNDVSMATKLGRPYCFYRKDFITD